MIISLFIILDSKGGILYIQRRVGKNKRDFNLLKFRTMYVNAEKNGSLTIGNHDPRITRVGLFLRKTKMDELPQLINVLKGEMSFVGPRPEVREFVDYYTEEQTRVFSVKPGISSFAGIYYSNENEILGKASDPKNLYFNHIMPHKLQMDLDYIDNQSFILDLKIIFQTIIHIFKKSR